MTLYVVSRAIALIILSYVNIIISFTRQYCSVFNAGTSSNL